MNYNKNLEVIKKLSQYNYNKLLRQNKVVDIVVEETRRGKQTIKAVDSSDGREVYLHSKYDPMREAEKFIDGQAEYIEKHPHILFYGVGLGYHIEVFKLKYPDKLWSFYEPEMEVFQKFMEIADFSKFLNWKFKYMNIEISDNDRNIFLSDLANQIHDSITIITLPSYENMYSEKLRSFEKDFLDKIKNRKQSVLVETAFAKRWVINSLMNLPYTFTSKDLLIDYSNKFQGKPIIIVAAGPSLQFEYDNLRKIKEEGRAYIFAVGSANKALINNDIYPDLVTSYDPQSHNYNVYKPIIDKQIDSIPMAYGTSVGFETLIEYPGKFVHMITSQDTVSPYYLKRLDEKELEFINDAPTIAVVTLQLAIKMQVSEIYLVGQNLAFLEDLRYAESVHKNNKELVKKRELDIKNEEKTVDVYGNEIKSSYGFNKMREEMEAYIKHYETSKIFNTTKGGAAIAGAPFVNLNDVVREMLEIRNVDEDWFGRAVQLVYENRYILQKIDDMDYSVKRGRRQIKELFDIIENISKNYQTQNAKNLRRLFSDFDKVLDKFQKLDVWKVYVERIVRVYTETVNKKSHEITATDDFVERGRIFAEIFPSYILQIKQVLEELVPVIKDVHVKLERLVISQKLIPENSSDINKEKCVGKIYPCDSRLIKYEGNWQDHNYLPTDSNICKLVEKFTSEKGAKVSFRFTGTSIKIYSSSRVDRSSNIRLSINGEQHETSQKDTNIIMTEMPSTWYKQFSIDNLEAKTIETIEDSHLVEIELLDDDIMSLMAIEVDDQAILIHPDEVSSVDELELGSRIRCHYKADSGQTGVFSQLGINEDIITNINKKKLESSDGLIYFNKASDDNPDKQDCFISPKSSANPDGYFYFVMVDYNEDGSRVLIADRNVQHTISWDTLNKVGLVFGKTIQVDGHEVISRMLSGGQAFLRNDGQESYTATRLGAYPPGNEYDKYIVNSSWGSLLNWNWNNMYSWCQQSPLLGNYISFAGDKSTIDEKKQEQRVIVRGNHCHSLWGSILFKDKDVQENNIAYRPLITIKI